TTIAARMMALAEGEVGTPIPFAGRKDEVGAMASALEVFRDNAHRVERMRGDQEEMQRHAEQQRKQSVAHLADEFEHNFSGVLETVSAAVEKMRGVVGVLRDTADVTFHQAEETTERSDKNAQLVRTIVDVAENLGDAVDDIAAKVRTAGEIISRAGSEVRRTDAMVAALSNAASRIGEVVRLISDIASQTNLLALNATIEAARAGDAGKGFAVVAGEVKALANQTAKATDEIGGQIAEIQGSTREAVGAIRIIRETITEVERIAEEMSAATRQQAVAMAEIAGNLASVAHASDEVATSVTRMARTSAETGRAAVEVDYSAGELANQAQLLRDNAKHFVDEVRKEM
ncbi:MAG: HAMP domain-containing protein, partial [Rhodospirillales bacterium]|nr:HAMP domain-containing protein [Rhodospirillales bacterium]